MYLVLVATCLWGVSLLLLAKVLWLGDQPAPAARDRWVFGGLLLLAALLFFRPHEDIFGGQDTGAYLNGSVAFAREGMLSYEDEMLAMLPVAERAPFLISKHYTAKYHCLWLPDPTKPVMQTWFQPAFPVMAGLLTHVFPPISVLYVIPFMALCAGLAVRALASQLSRHPWAGNAAFVCYILNPLVVWHARHPRPEIIASFLLFGGAALLVTAWKARRCGAWIDLLLGALCVGLAPFFHITAWSVVITVVLLGLTAVIAGRDDFMAVPVVACAMLGLFMWQIFCVRDTYGLRRFVQPLVPFAGGIIALAIVCAVVLLIISRSVRRSRASTQDGFLGGARRGWTLPLRWMGGSLILMAYVAVAWAAYRTSSAELKLGASHFVHRTDLRCVVEMVSLPSALVGLAGLLVLVVCPGPRRAARWVVPVAFVPATLVLGDMFDFFMTRYMLVVLLPLLAVAQSAIASLVPYARLRKRLGFCYVVFLMCFLGLYGRTLIVTHTNFKGVSRFIGRVADRIKQENGMLLCEYAKIAAPFDLFYGVSTLGLDNERQWDYTAAERAWLRIMQSNPRRPAFFVTPYERTPLSAQFDFIPVEADEYTCTTLYAPRWDFPTDVSDWGLGLSLYRMVAREPGAVVAPAVCFPWCVDFGDGNMGLYRFHRPERVANVSMPCVSLHPRQSLHLSPLPADDGAQARIFMVVKRDAREDGPPQVRVELDEVSLPVSTESLVNEWWLCRVSLPPMAAGAPRRVAICGDAHTSVAMVRAVSGARVAPLFNAWQAEGHVLEPVQPFSCRWVTQDGGFLARVPSGPVAYLLTFSLTPMEWGDKACLQLQVDAGDDQVSAPLSTSGFVWELWPIRRDDGSRSTVSCAMTSVAAPSSGTGNKVTSMPVAMGHAVVVAN